LIPDGVEPGLDVSRYRVAPDQVLATQLRMGSEVPVAVQYVAPKRKSRKFAMGY
jgi:hypothetical protein